MGAAVRRVRDAHEGGRFHVTTPARTAGDEWHRPATGRKQMRRRLRGTDFPVGLLSGSTRRTDRLEVGPTPIAFRRRGNSTTEHNTNSRSKLAEIRGRSSRSRMGIVRRSVPNTVASRAASGENSQSSGCARRASRSFDMIAARAQKFFQDFRSVFLDILLP